MSAYTDLILATSGLVAYWPLQEIAGTAADDINGANDGVYSGTHTKGVPLSSILGNGVTFAGGYVTVANSAALQFAGDFSIECWLRTSSSSTGLAVITKYVNTTFAGYGLGVDAGKVRIWVGDNTLGWFPSVTSVNTNTLRHVVVTRSGTSVKVFIDGNLDSSGTRTPSLANTTNLYIATTSANPGTGGFPGTVAHAAVYNVALSLATIASHYAAGLPPFKARLPKPVSQVWRPASAPAGCKVYVPFVGHVPVIRNFVDGTGGIVTGTPTWLKGDYGPQLGGFNATNHASIATRLAVLGEIYPCWWASLFTNTVSTVNCWMFSQTSASTNRSAGCIVNSGGVSGTLTSILKGNSTNSQVSASGLIYNDGLPHVVMAISRHLTDHRLYLDGIEVGSGVTNPGGTVDATGFQFGLQQFGTLVDPFTGSLIAFLAGRGAAPSPVVLAEDLLSGRFSAIRPVNRVFQSSAAAIKSVWPTRVNKLIGGN